MASNLAYTLIFGKPLIIVVGIMTFLSLSVTALSGILNRRGIHVIPFSWHIKFAGLTICLALFHAFLALS